MLRGLGERRRPGGSAICKFMQVDFSRRLICLAAALAFSVPVCAQQTSGAFRWIDFHSPQDQNIVIWVTRSLEIDQWTAIREIGVVYDAALVVTTDRATPQSPPGTDTFTVWNASLSSHVVAPLLKGVNLRWFDWEHFAPGQPEELTVLYDNCSNCAASTYFTAFYYDQPHHMWAARWIRGGQGALAWSAIPPSASGIVWTQVYAVLTSDENRVRLCTWNHLDFGKKRLPSDTIFCYDVDPISGLDRTLEVTGRDADAMKLSLCRGQNNVQGLERGQDSTLCEQLLHAQPERKPVTTPPANNQGRSAPPRSR
jgi:hypothetical protein